MVKSQVNIRLEDALINALKARAALERVTVTDLVTKYIQLGLEQPAKAAIAVSDFRKLEHRLSALELEMGKYAA